MEVTLTIDGKQVKAPVGTTVLTAARANGIYVPALCAHPDLPPACSPAGVPGRAAPGICAGGGGGGEENAFGGCRVCLVEVAERGILTSCALPAQEGMSVKTSTPEVVSARRVSLAKILGNHPHACLTCPQREGCSRTQCSQGVPEKERCCAIFNNCELRKVSDYVGIPGDTPRFIHIDLPVVKDEPFFDRDYNLCIDCRRCLRACNDVRGVGALKVIEVGSSGVSGPEWGGPGGSVSGNSVSGNSVYGGGGSRKYVGPIAATLVESGCKFCGACVEVCPTGALTDRTLNRTEREKSLVPCKFTCPAEIDVPRYVQLVGLGRYGEATAVVREKLPFPGILGRVCFNPCETTCRRKQLDAPIAIRSLKRFAADRDTGLWRQHSKQAPPTGHKAAVVGSGPAGLTAAYYLAKKGHSVTIFEALPEPGGMMRVGIPEFRMPRDILAQEIDEVRKVGVEIRCGTRVEDVGALLAEGYQAVFLGVGAHLGDQLGVPGEDLPGVIDGVTFLRRAALGDQALDQASGEVAAASSVAPAGANPAGANPAGAIKVGRRVAVIGGGNVATDAARTARRLGAGEVDLIYRRTRSEMPAYDEEIEGAVHEGVTLRFLTAPKSVSPAPDCGSGGLMSGTLALECVRMELGEPDSSGRRRPVPVSGSEFVENYDLIIAAIGQKSEIPEGFGVVSGKGGVIQVREDNLLTSRPGVYAGGDVVLGPSSVIEAVAQGRRAASAIDAYLGGDGDIEEVLLPDWHTDPHIGREEGFASRPRTSVPHLPAEGRLPGQGRSGWAEIELGYSEEAARSEGLRCLKCNLRLEIDETMLPPEAWLDFNQAAIDSVPENEGVFQLLDADKNILMIKGTPNIRQGLSEQLGRDENAKFFVYEEDPMYTSRESQLIQAYLQQYGKMPGGGSGELDDLF